MHWDQLHTENFARDMLSRALADALAIDHADLEVGELDGTWGPSTNVRAEVSTHPGDFPLRIDVHFREGPSSECSKDAVAKALAKGLGVKLLRDDGTPDPYRRLLVTPDGNEAPVLLDSDALDDDDALVLCISEEPTLPPRKRATKPAKDDRVQHLLGAFFDATPIEETDAQRQALQTLRKYVTESASAEEIRTALLTVQEVFTPEQLAHPFTTVSTIVEAAKLSLD